jgi:protein-tyrosine-phosphatase
VSHDAARAVNRAQHRPVILFLCVHNAGRSQMAAAFARLLGGERVLIHSAGSAPGETLNPAVVMAMNEIALDITDERPRTLTDQMARDADVVVTMGCGDACPYYPGKRYEDWELTDPAGQSLEIVRTIRDEIEGRVRELLRSLGVGVE